MARLTVIVAPTVKGMVSGTFSRKGENDLRVIDRRENREGWPGEIVVRIPRRFNRIVWSFGSRQPGRADRYQIFGS